MPPFVCEPFHALYPQIDGTSVVVHTLVYVHRLVSMAKGGKKGAKSKTTKDERSVLAKALTTGEEWDKVRFLVL